MTAQTEPLESVTLAERKNEYLSLTNIPIMITSAPDAFMRWKWNRRVLASSKTWHFGFKILWNIWGGEKDALWISENAENRSWCWKIPLQKS